MSPTISKLLYLIHCTDLLINIAVIINYLSLSSSRSHPAEYRIIYLAFVAVALGSFSYRFRIRCRGLRSGGWRRFAVRNVTGGKAPMFL